MIFPEDHAVVVGSAPAPLSGEFQVLPGLDGFVGQDQLDLRAVFGRDRAEVVLMSVGDRIDTSPVPDGRGVDAADGCDQVLVEVPAFEVLAEDLQGLRVINRPAVRLEVPDDLIDVLLIDACHGWLLSIVGWITAPKSWTRPGLPGHRSASGPASLPTHLVLGDRFPDLCFHAKVLST